MLYRKPSDLYASIKRFLYYHGLLSIVHDLNCDLLCIFRRNIKAIKIFGMTLLVDLCDKGASRDYFVNRIREPESTKIFIKFLRGINGDVLDVGAHIGYYALIEARYSRGHVYACEPNPWSYKLLRANIHINGLEDRVRMYNVALGDRNQIIKFIVDKQSNLSRVDPNASRNIRVRMTTVDDLFKDTQISYIRMDVEGYELKILQGARKTLENVSGLFIEVHPQLMKDYGYTVKDFYDFLSRYDFKVAYIVKPIVYKNPPLKKVLLRQIRIRDYGEIKIERIQQPITKVYENLLKYKGAYHIFLER